MPYCASQGLVGWYSQELLTDIYAFAIFFQLVVKGTAYAPGILFLTSSPGHYVGLLLEPLFD